MALLSKVFRGALGVPLRGKIKERNVDREVDFSDDSDDALTTHGSNMDPLDPPYPGIKLTYPEIPTEYFYGLAGIQKPRVSQPAYMSFVKDEQLWHIFNASSITLGRMACRISHFIQSKNRPYYSHSTLTPEHQADFIVVVNGKYPLIYGTKGKMKIYRKHSGYPGHLQELNIRQVLSKDWKRVVKQSVSGMLPKNNLRPKYLERLHIFPEIYHNFDFLPQFISRPLPDPNLILQNQDLLNDPTNTIIFNATPGKVPEQFKDLKYEPQDVETLFHMRPEAPGHFSNKELKSIKRYNRLVRRLKVFNHRTQKFEIK
jgi:large subunit ribosomal protein L13